MTESSAPSARPGRLLPVVVSFLLGVALTVGAWLVHQRGQHRQQMNAQEEIRAILEEQTGAWNHGDLERFLATYWDDDELTFYSGGDINRGLKAVAERYRRNYQAEGKEMGQLTFSGLEVQQLDGEWALARGKWQVKKSKESIGGLFTLLLRRFPDGWQIVHDHTSR